jgi:hypothetical protein
MFLAALALASTAVAQPAKKNAEELPVPPTTTKLEQPYLIVPYLLAFMLIGAIVGVAAIPSKRGHQD